MRASFYDSALWTRRRILRSSIGAIGAMLVAPAFWGYGKSSQPAASAGQEPVDSAGLLLEPDANGLHLPPGFKARVVARSGKPPIPGGAYVWPLQPDGGATFPTSDGGWVYVANSEVPAGRGGAGALRFDSQGNVVQAYSILHGTSRNCAGGPTPWGTWLSCEEVEAGRVWECDPMGVHEPIVRPALGVFNHEAAAVDPETGHLYLTEDQPDGRFYRFTPGRRLPDGRPDLSAGSLEVAQVIRTNDDPEGRVNWLRLKDPLASERPTRRQIPESTPFDRGEGMWFRSGIVYFATTGDDRLWVYRTADGVLSILYDDDRYSEPVLTGVDNVVCRANGDVLVAEDGGDMQLVTVTPGGTVSPLVQIDGHQFSEVAGPAFDPSGTRLYFSSQRGPGFSGAGVTYEVTGPFRA